MKPLLIACEGIDGSGKTTSVEYLSKILRQKGHSVKVVRAMGSGEMGHIVRELLLKQYFTPDESTLACALAIMDAYKTALKYIDEGHTVILDRFIGTYYAYNNKANEERLAAPMFQLLFAHDEVITRHPDRYVYLSVDIQAAKERMGQRHQALTHFDEADLPYYERLQEGFQEFSIHYTGPEWVHVDNNHTVSYLQQQLDAILQSLE